MKMSRLSSAPSSAITATRGLFRHRVRGSLRRSRPGAPAEASIDYKALVEQVPAITYLAGVGAYGEWRYISPQVYPILGFTPEQFTTELWLRQLHPDDKNRMVEEEQALLRSSDQQRQVTEYRLFASDGRVVWISDEYVLFYTPEGEPLYRGVLLDITERKEIQQAAAMQGRRFHSLVQEMSDVIAVFDAGGTIDYVSPSIEGVLGFYPKEQIGTSSLALVHPEDVAGTRELLDAVAKRPGDAKRIQLRLQHKDRTWRWIEMTVTNLLDDPSVGGLVSNYRDITDRKALEDQLRHRALHDPLTGLANRALLVDRITQSLSRGKRLHQRLAVLFIDLDGFKAINDTLGHAAGDAFMLRTAHRMTACLRANDTAARVGGDEFVVLLEDAAVIEDVATTAERIIESIGATFAWNGKERRIRPSIGIVFSGSGGEAVEELLHNADAAMYAAKTSGKGGYEMHRPEDGRHPSKNRAGANAGGR